MNPTYLARKARGKCADCGADAEGRSRCKTHLAVHVKREKKRRDAKKNLVPLNGVG